MSFFSGTHDRSGRQETGHHFVSGRELRGPYPTGTAKAIFAMGCFWGAERLFWRLGDGIWITAVGYTGGTVPDPTYEQVCTGKTGHAEAVLIAYDPRELGYEDLLQAFWTNHDPTQGMRQGNDIGSQYRSGIHVFDEEQRRAAEAAKAVYDEALAARGFGPVTTEIVATGPFYFAEDYHQQYLAKNPNGYCGLQGTGVSCTL